MSRRHRLVTRTCVAVAAVALVLASSAFGQQRQGDTEGGQRRTQPQDGGGGGGRRGFGGPGGGGGFFGGGGGMRGLFEAGVSSREVDTMKSMLGLSGEQDEAVRALFEGYQSSSNELVTTARETMDQMREELRADFAEGGGDGFRRMGEEMEKFRKARKDLETGFFNDVKAVLTEDQLAKWPRVERSHRRESTIGRGLMAGERIDVVQLVNDLKLEAVDRAALDPVLDQYETDLDRELAARNDVYDRAQGQMRELMQSGDADKMQKIFDDGRAASTRVRDVNRRYARQVEGMLPETARAQFSDAVKRQSFPMIYRPTQAGRAIETASKFSDLSAEQKSSLDSISASYNRELSAINKEMEQAWEKREASFSPRDLMGGRGRGGMFGEDDESQALRDRRRALDESTVDKIKAILTPEQVEQLPSRDRAGGPGNRDGGEGDQADQPRRRNREPRNNDGGRQSIPRPTPGPTR